MMYSFPLILIISLLRRSFFLDQIINLKPKYVGFKKDDTVIYFYYNKFNYLRLDCLNLYVNKIEEVNKFKFRDKSSKPDEELTKSEYEMS